MIKRVPDYDVLEKCIKDILSLIKPSEDDRNKRLSAIQELENSIQSVAAFRGAAAKPFGSFLSNLYSKSGDLDLSIQIVNSSNLRISKNKKQNILRELRRALQIRGVARCIEFIPRAKVPVLQYVSNRFDVSCDLSIDNYPGRIKSRIFYWISTLDERFGDMVLLIKEWAKAQNINDSKTGTLNSYSLCLLVLFHFQTCEPAILPPLKDIYEGNITDMTLYNEEHIDEVCAANIAKFLSQNKEQRNESSLCYLLVTFFHKFHHINALSSDVISTYTGQFEQIQDNPSWTAKSYSLFVEDPVERPDNAARAVGVKGLLQIASAFNDANHKFASLEHTDRMDLLAMLCTSVVCSNLGGRIVANSYANTPQRTHQHARSFGRVAAIPSDNQCRNGARRFAESRPVHSPRQVHTTGRQTGQPGQYQHHVPPQVHTNTKGRQTGQPGQYQHHVPPLVHTNTTGCQTAGQRGLYPNHNTSGYQTSGQRGLYPNYNTSGYQTSGQRGLYPNHNTSGYQTSGLHQNQSHPQVHNTWVQAAGPYNNGNHPHVYTTGLPPPGLDQNYYNHPQLYNTGPQTEGYYQNQQGRKFTPGRQTKRNGVTVRYEAVVTGLKNEPGRDSRSQASSSRQHGKGATNIS